MKMDASIFDISLNMMHGGPLPVNKASLLCTLTVMALCLSLPSHPTVPYNFEPKLEKDEQLFHS